MANTTTAAATSGVQTWIAGFTYRGRAPWEAASPDYHIEIGQYVEIPGRDPAVVGTQMLTPDAADASGFSLPTILSAIGGQALVELSALRTEAADLRSRNATLEQSLKMLEEETAKSCAVIDELRTQLTALRKLPPKEMAVSPEVETS